MKCNVGGMDRKVRFGLGAGALGLALLRPMSKRARLATLALATSGLLTATSRYCPVSQLLGVNTCERRLRLKRRGASMARVVGKVVRKGLRHI